MTKLTGRIGNGAAVHIISHSQAVCGAGVNTIGTKRRGRVKLTGEPVTCQRCLDRLKRQQANTERVTRTGRMDLRVPGEVPGLPAMQVREVTVIARLTPRQAELFDDMVANMKRPGFLWWRYVNRRGGGGYWKKSGLAVLPHGYSQADVQEKAEAVIGRYERMLQDKA